MRNCQIFALINLFLEFEFETLYRNIPYLLSPNNSSYILSYISIIWHAIVFVEYFSSTSCLPLRPIASSFSSDSCRNSRRASAVASVPISVHHPHLPCGRI